MNFVQTEPIKSDRRSVRGPVAIVGIGCRFPGSANSPSAFWNLLKSKTCAISEVPSDRWNSRRFYSPHADAPMKAVSKWGGFTREMWDFDAEFFGISPREAEAMDPQQRMFLLVTWEAFEDAGIAPDRLAGSNTGVFVGISTTDYQGFQGKIGLDTDLSHSCTGAAPSIVSNRVSNRLNFQGPSMSIDTACSSSLVAAELACRNLWSRDCDVAVAGGVNALLLPQVYVNFSKARMLSPTGRVLTFDARADGFVRAEGAGAIILKRLDDALADGDRIYAVITGTAVNQDGYTPTLTVPSAEAQAKMLRQVCRDAGIRPGDVGYVEAHGTGTPVGDPIEASAIGSVFGVDRDRSNSLMVGSVKTNVGHLESGAGVCGLIKTALSVYHGEILPNANFETINPNIPLHRLNFEIARECRPWEPTTRRRAVVNSFGFGGTNASAVVEEAPPTPVPIPGDGSAKRQWVVPLSAATATAMPAVAERLANAIEGELSGVPLRDVVGTLSARRAHLAHRTAILANSRADLVRKLRAVASGDAASFQNAKPPSIVTGRRDADPKIAFVFSGQGSQWCGMARKLLRKDPVFRAAITPVNEALQRIGGWSVIEEINRPKSTTRIDETSVTQGCIFAVQAALAARWLDWGIRPSLIMGHSLGEIAAAHMAGALTLGDAVKVVHFRSTLQAETEGKGAIFAVGVPFEEVEDRLAAWDHPEVALAAINGNQLVSVAGERESVHGFIRQLKKDLGPDIFVRRIRMNFAPHSPQMDVIKDRFHQALADIKPQPTKLPLVSTVTGEEIDGREMDASYWWRNIRAPVRFQNGVQTAIEAGADMFIEVGPDAPLSGLVAASLAEAGIAGRIIPSLKRKQPDIETLNSALASAFVSGAQPDWGTVVGEPCNFVELPRYPFEMKQFIFERERIEYHLGREPPHPLLGERLNEASPAWFCELRLEHVRYFADHVIDEAILMPATAYLEMMLSVGHQLFGEGSMELENVEISAGIFLAKDKTVLIHTTYDPERRLIAIYARPDISGAEWTLRIQATLTHRPLKSPPRRLRPKSLRSMRHFSRKGFYELAKHYGYNYEGPFRSVTNMWMKPPHAFAEISTPRDLKDKDAYVFHPALMDAACAQAPIIFLADRRAEGGVAKLYVPQRFKRIRLFKRPTKRLCVFEERTSETNAASTHDLLITDSDGNAVMEIEEARALNILLGRQFSSSNQEDVRFGEEDWSAIKFEGNAESADQSGAWLLFADHSGLTDKLADKLKRRKNRCVRVGTGPFYRFGSNGSAEIDPKDPSQFERLLHDIQSLDLPLRGIVYAWGLDHTDGTPPLTLAELKQVQSDVTLPALYLVRGLIKTNMSVTRLAVVTAGAKVIPGDGSGSARGLALAPVAGSVRTVLAECPSLDCRVIDLDPRDRNPENDAERILTEFCGGAENSETEVAYRRGQRFVPRYRNKSLEVMPPRTMRAAEKSKELGFSLTMSGTGELDKLMIMEAINQAPGRGQVAIAVKAGGLNFRDVMAATGLLPPDAEDTPAWRNLGLEFSGIVETVGRGVTGLKAGDRVIGYGRGCFRSQIVVPASAVCRMPKKLDFAEGATIPIAFMTAYYGLIGVARLQKGEKVLIHLATGGVGLAAIQIARIVGAEIFATAGSPKKRAYLRKLGIKHVMDSRSLAFADEVMSATKGRGVDVILNSLAGAAIDKGLSILAPCGRFLEIGKRDIYMNKAVGLLALRKNANFFAIDLARLAEDSPERLKSTFAEIEEHFNQGRMKPLPTDTFPIDRASDAFRHMASAKHIGKVVITIDAKDADIALDTDRPIAFERKAAYLITGGLSGFGLKIAEWLAQNGAGHLYLCSRSGTPNEDASRVIGTMRKGGATVTTLAADVAQPSNVDQVLKRIAEDGHKLRGVIHAAGVIEDGFIVDLTAERFDRAMAPKVFGAWNLHEATRSMGLDHFVLCSSIASVLGTIAQANYVAANSFMDALACYRNEIGLPGLSINWGALGGAGMVERDEELKKYMEQAGFGQVPLKDSLKALDTLMRKSRPQVTCVKINWPKYARSNPRVAAQPRLAEVMTGKRAAVGAARQQVLDAPPAERTAVVVQYLKELVSTVLKVDPSKIDANQPLRRLGLDSLASFQLKNRIESDHGITLDVSTFLQNPNVTKLSEMMVGAIEATTSSEAEGSRETRAEGQLSIRQKAILAEFDDPMASPALLQSYEVTTACIVSPRIDLPLFRQAFDRQVGENPILRARFPLRDGRRGLEIADKHALGLEVTDCTGMNEGAFRQLLERKAGEPFDLATGPLYRVHIFHRPDDRDAVLMRAHTSIMDGWSLLLTLRHFGGPYVGWAEGAGLLGQPTLKFSDFVAWQRNFVSNPKGRTQLSYWRQKLRGLGGRLNLPFDFARDQTQPRRGDSVHFVLDQDLTRGIEHFAAAADSTTFSVLMAIYAVLLRGHSGSDDIPITTAVAGRTRIALESIVGPLANSVIIRAKLRDEIPFTQFLAELGDTTKDALSHQDYPLVELQKTIGGGFDWGASSANQVSFSMYLPHQSQGSEIAILLQNFPGVVIDLGGGQTIETLGLSRAGCRRDLSAYVQESQGRIYMRFEYDASLFRRETVERMAGDYMAIAREILRNPQASLSLLALGSCQAPLVVQAAE